MHIGDAFGFTENVTEHAIVVILPCLLQSAVLQNDTYILSSYICHAVRIRQQAGFSLGSSLNIVYFSHV